MKDINKWIESNEDDIYYSRKPNKRHLFLKVKITRFGKFELLTAVKYDDLPNEIKEKIENNS